MVCPKENETYEKVTKIQDLNQLLACLNDLNTNIQNGIQGWGCGSGKFKVYLPEKADPYRTFFG